MNLKGKAISGAKWTTVGTIARSIFQLAQIAILTRFLPKEAFGLVAMALFVIQFSNIFIDLGFTTAILHRQNATEREYSSIFWLNLFIALVLYTFLLATSHQFATFYNEKQLSTIIPILGLNLIFTALGRQHRTILQKQLKFKKITVIETISIVVGLVVAIITAVYDFGILSLIYSTLASSVIANFSFLWNNIKTNPIQFHFNLKEVNSFFKIGAYSMGSSFLDFFSREIDILIVGKVLGASNLGIYSLCKQIAMKLYSLINPVILSVLSPLLSSIQNDNKKIGEIYIKLINYLALINFPFYFLITICSMEILYFFYGSEYSSYSTILSFLAVSYYVLSISNPVGILQIATGRTDVGFKWTVFRLILTPIAILISASFGLTILASVIAILNILLIFPLWFIQIKPMINVGFAIYIDQFFFPIMSILSFTIFYYLFFDIFFIELNVFTSFSIKLFCCLAISFTYLKFFNKRVYEDFRLIISSLKLKL